MHFIRFELTENKKKCTLKDGIIRYVITLNLPDITYTITFGSCAKHRSV